MEFERTGRAARISTRGPARFFNSDSIDTEDLHRGLSHLNQHPRPEAACGDTNPVNRELVQGHSLSRKFHLRPKFDGMSFRRVGNHPDEVAFAQSVIQFEVKAGR